MYAFFGVFSCHYQHTKVMNMSIIHFNMPPNHMSEYCILKTK